MNYTTHDDPQGSPGWLALRQNFDTASEAPAALGKSKYTSRNDLLKLKATGITEEVGAVKQKLFDRGHETEHMARAMAAEIIGDDIFPITASISVDGLNLLASLDGITMDDETIWEHKLWSESLAEAVRSGTLDPHYTIQLDQQLLVTGASRCLFMTSDGTPDKMAYCWYESSQDKVHALLSGWRQFRDDRANYQHVEVLPAPVANAIQSLPALSVALVGEVTASNLSVYRATALNFIENIKTDLKTDQDFADAESMVKFCDATEKELDTVKRLALGQTASIDELFRTIDSLQESMKSKRLMLDKLVKARKETIRVEILQEGVTAMAAHIATLNARLGKPYMPAVPVDFASAIKGKRTVTSLHDAVDTTLAAGKIAASAIADRIQINLETLRELAIGHAFLFADTPSIVLKANDDLRALVENRIAAHKAEEERKEEAQRERIRAEEVARIEREREAERREHQRQAELEGAVLLHRQEIEKAKAEELARQQSEEKPALALMDSAQPAINIVAPDAIKLTGAVVSIPLRKPVVDAGPPTLKLGVIADRLGFALTADFLKSLGFDPAATVGASKLYHESSFTHICAALVDHINQVQTKQAA
jgi:predicted phage-related endonuclease